MPRKNQTQKQLVFLLDLLVTEITPLGKFYPMEDYHNDYFNLNGTKPYCSAIIAPKVKKFRAKFANRLKN